MGPAEEFLNIRITQRPGQITIDKEPYVRTILEKYQPYIIGRRNHADVPSMSEYMQRDDPSATEKQRQFVESFPYPAIAGSPLYLAVVTRGENGVILDGKTHPSCTQNRAVPTHHRTADAPHWRSRLALDVGKCQKQTRCIDSPVRRRGGVCQMRRKWGHLFYTKKAPLLHTEPG
jgi:hypothetical protein